MVWPQITEPRCGCAGAARRYSRPWGRGMRDGADSLPPRGVQIGIIQLFATMASPWAVPYEKLVTSALGTRCLVVSSRCLVSLARPAPPPLPPLQWRLLPYSCGRTSAPWRAGVQNRKSSVLSLPSGRFGLDSDWCLANRTVVTGAPAQQILAQGHASITYSTAFSSTPYPDQRVRGNAIKNRCFCATSLAE